jgi:hypothetical protein
LPLNNQGSKRNSKVVPILSNSDAANGTENQDIVGVTSSQQLASIAKQTIRVAKRNKTKNPISRHSLSIDNEEQQFQKNTSDYDNLSDSLDRCFSDGYLNKNEYVSLNSNNPKLELDVDILSRFDRFKFEEHQHQRPKEIDFLNDAVCIDTKQPHTALECLETDFYKLYRVVLEQSHLETWDNTEETSFNSRTTLNNTLDENKITISCKQPLSPVNNRNSAKNIVNKSLNFAQPDSWSNFNCASEEDEEEPELVETRDAEASNKLNSVSTTSTSPHSIEEFSQETNLTSPILARPETISTITDDVEKEIQTFVNSHSFDKKNNEIKITLSPSPNFQAYEEKQEAELSAIERKSLNKSPVEDLENQLQFYERIERSFFLELERNSFSLTPSSSSDTNSPNTPRKRSLTSSERKFFSSSLSASPTPESTNTLLNSNAHVNLKANMANLVFDINPSEISQDLISPNTKEAEEEAEQHEDVKSISNSSHDNSNSISINSNSSEANAINSCMTNIENINISQNNKHENKIEAAQESEKENIINFLVDKTTTTTNTAANSNSEDFNSTNKSILKFDKTEKKDDEAVENNLISNSQDLDEKIEMNSNIVDLQDLTNTVDHEHRKDLPRRRSMTLKHHFDNRENNENETVSNKSSLFTSLSPIEVNREVKLALNEAVVAGDKHEKLFEKQISFKNGKLNTMLKSFYLY